MTPLAFNLGPTELLIILAIVLLLFGGTRLAGLGKSSGKALREFKEETSSLRSKDEKGEEAKGVTPGDEPAKPADAATQSSAQEPAEAEIVEDPATRRHDA